MSDHDAAPPELDADAILAAANVWQRSCGTFIRRYGWVDRVKAGIRAAGVDPADVRIVTFNTGGTALASRDFSAMSAS